MAQRFRSGLDQIEGDPASHEAIVSEATDAFRRHGEPPPLTYARRQRLSAVHDALRAAAAEGGAASITEIAMAHGFTDDKTVWEETGKSDTIHSKDRPGSTSLSTISTVLSALA